MKRIEYIGQHDSFKLMEKLSEKKVRVDAIITDPPYNVSRQSNFHTMGRKGVDFGEWDKNFDVVSWIAPALTLLKKGGNIVIFNDWKNMSYIKDELEKHGCLIKEMLMWRKTNPMPRNRDRLYVTSCEFVIWATNGKDWTFNRQRDTYENTIFEYPVVNHKQRIHPTQKPLELMKDIVKIHTNEDDIVFDPFGGSFTTSAACKELKRQYISCDLENEYVKKGKERLAQII